MTTKSINNKADMKHCFITLALLAVLSACGPSSKTPAVPSRMDEDVNIGYGSMSRKDLGFAVDKVEVDNNLISSYSSIAEYLRGRVPGVEVNERGGIRIRGNNSIIGPTDALIVVDGVICEDINSVNPNMIQSVEVLKDGSSSIYGMRGANGVVLITTKAAFEKSQAELEARRAAKEAEKEARKAARKAKKQ